MAAILATILASPILSAALLAAAVSLVISILVAFIFGGRRAAPAERPRRGQPEYHPEKTVQLLLTYPSKWRLRSFETIKHHLGGFDDNEDELRKLLLRAGAVRWRSRDGRELWGLVARNRRRLKQTEIDGRFNEPAQIAPRPVYRPVPPRPAPPSLRQVEEEIAEDERRYPDATSREASGSD